MCTLNYPDSQADEEKKTFIDSDRESYMARHLLWTGFTQY
jgi:hypothetical protein